MIMPFKSETQIIECDTESLKDIVSEVQKRGLGIFFQQNLDQKKLITLMKRIGQCETANFFMNDKEYPEIFQVTGRLNSFGEKIGMFGDGELGWHSNGNSRHNVDEILIALFCVQSDVNTTLSVCQTSMPFYELSETEQDYWKSVTIRLSFQNNSVYNLEKGDPELEFFSKSPGSIRKLVDKHPVTGDYYFYFPYHFITKAWVNSKRINHTEMIEQLKPIIFKSKYQHHIILNKGDLVFMDQFTTLHRRTPVLGDRLLWRVACNYRNLYESY